MSLYLKLFKTTNQYNAYTADTANFIKPNVSNTEDAPTIVYFNPLDPYNGYEYVDLGLPSGTKWAKRNVGGQVISGETDYGDYFMYGKGESAFTTTSGESAYSGQEIPLAKSADTAAQVMGGDWHMPTREQMEELVSNTTYEWTSINGVYGGKLTATNGNYVFFPAAGCFDQSGHNDEETHTSRCLGSTTHGGEFIYSLFCDSENSGTNRTALPSYGYSIRGVVG